jgi:glycosyltransferase involved in cell wall biosynthesis
MKIALVHDYLKDYGGAELVLETLSDIFPDAQIFTTIYAPQYFGPHRARLEKKWQGRIHQSFLGFLPLAPKLLSPFRFLSPLAFKSFNFSGYDLIITSATGAFFPNSLHKKSAKLICYCHTPPRYLYGLVTARSLNGWFYRLVNIPLQITLHFYRLLDFKYAQTVDQFIANSATTTARIKKYYRKDSIIINPPVDVPGVGATLTGAHKGDFFVTGGRLARAKRYDIAVKACNQLKVPLKIFGRSFAGYESELKKIIGPTIEFLGEITNEEKQKLLTSARAFIFCSDNEDFGIAPVEAMACGTPVVAYRSGGTVETVIDGKTGIFFDELTPNSCAVAIGKVGALLAKAQTKNNCISRARQFSKEIFIQKIRDLVNAEI